jgi:hypothetical protein
MAEKTKKTISPVIKTTYEVTLDSGAIISLPIYVKNEHVCMMFQIEPTHLAEFRITHGVPFYKIDRKISYRLDELLEFHSHFKNN